jgi:hypothetical protein
MKKLITTLKYSLLPVMLLLMTFCRAQENAPYREFNFKKGGEYQRLVAVKSNCILQRGNQKINISTYSAVTKTYKVSEVSGKKYQFNISINKILDTVNALGQKVVFNSENTPDPNSDIQMNLLHLIGQTAVVSVNDRSEILTIHKPARLDDTLLSFTGIQPEIFAAGKALEIFSNRVTGPFIKAGFTWTNHTATTETTYTIKVVNGLTTTINYTSSVLGTDVNSRINGVLLIENESGLILKKATQSVSTGYKIVNGIVYTTTRRSATSEVCRKIN